MTLQKKTPPNAIALIFDITQLNVKSYVWTCLSLRAQFKVPLPQYIMWIIEYTEAVTT